MDRSPQIEQPGVSPPASHADYTTGAVGPQEGREEGEPWGHGSGDVGVVSGRGVESGCRGGELV